MKQRMRIDDLTEQARVTQRTVRYYECIGLLPPAEREGIVTTTIGRNRLRKIDQAKQKVLAILRKHLAEAGSNFMPICRPTSNASSASWPQSNSSRFFIQNMMLTSTSCSTWRGEYGCQKERMSGLILHFFYCVETFCWEQRRR
jgi:hypothetical protein